MEKVDFQDLGDTFEFIYDYLDDKSLYQLKLINKYQKKNIKKKKPEGLIRYKINKLPIYQSHLHKMGDANSKPKYYKWLKNDFTIEEKALINIHLLEESEEQIRELPKYNQKRMIFSLNKDGLIYQLPSSSGIIKPDRSKKENKKDKEYVFIRVFELNNEYELNDGYGYFLLDYENNNENNNDNKNDEKKIVKRYKKIYFINDNFNKIFEDDEFEITDNIKEVLDKMTEKYNEYNNTKWTKYKLKYMNQSQILHKIRYYHFDS